MSSRKPHHPPLAGEIHRPTSDDPGYIHGSLAMDGFGSKDFYVAKIPRATAAAIILAHHYSKRIVQNSYVHLGVFYEGEMVGVLQFGYAMCPKFVGKIVANTASDEHLELNRMWLDDKAPRNSESRAISYVIKYIKRACPTVKWIQSFADERCGCLGVVYQASNFLFLGSHKTKFYELDGETYHSMLLTAHKKCGNRGRFLKENLARATVHSLNQFRYIFFVKPAFKRDLRMRPQPYPKPVKTEL